MWRDWFRALRARFSPYVWIPSLVLATGSLILFTRLPSGYVVKVSYDVSGDFTALEKIPGIIHENIRTLAPGDEIVCQADRSPTRIQCSGVFQRKRTARRLSRQLSIDIPSMLGWIDTEKIKARSTDKRTELANLTEKLAQSETAYDALDSSIVKTTRDSERLEKKKTQLESDLSNRQKQLEMLVAEPDSNATPKIRALYERKKTEVARNIEELKIKIQELTGALSDLSGALAEHDRVRQMRDQARTDVNTAQARIQTYESILNLKKGEPRIPDPDYFHVSALQNSENVETEYDRFTFLWAPWIGFLLLLGLRRNPLNPFQDDFFRNPDEVTQKTGLALLFRIPQTESSTTQN